jgi:hypothetical protein
MSRYTTTGRRMGDREADRAGRERLSAELPDVRAEERMWSDAVLDDVAGRYTGDPLGAEAGVDAEPDLDELLRRSHVMSAGDLWNLLRHNGGAM